MKKNSIKNHAAEVALALDELRRSAGDNILAKVARVLTTVAAMPAWSQAMMAERFVIATEREMLELGAVTAKAVAAAGRVRTEASRRTTAPSGCKVISVNFGGRQ